jgi:regulator of sigma E protease
MRDGDVVVRWDTIVNPTLGDILDSITAGGGKPVEVVVERDGAEVTLSITPERPVQLMGTPRPRIGVEFGVDDRSAVVADVAPNTPAAALGIPRGARILTIGDQPVANWFDIVAALRASAGQSVAVRYRLGPDETSGEFAVPSSIVNELGLPPLARIMKIGGEDRFELESGKVVSLPALQAVRALLQRNIGRTVKVEYQADPTGPAAGLQSAAFAVTADNADPWQMRIAYTPPRMTLQLMTEPLIERNPVKAIGLALSTTAMELYKVYRMIQSMAAMNVSLKHVSGPVGIFGVAYQEANAGVGDLLFFLAFLSVNLAVLNFLPMPVVDGGLMLFLILEKIRGKPVSIKVQVITTLTGLALIVLCFLFVTIQDITRLFGA